MLFEMQNYLLNYHNQLLLKFYIQQIMKLNQKIMWERDMKRKTMSKLLKMSVNHNV